MTRDIIERIKIHIHQLHEFGKLPDNWQWHKERVVELANIDKSLIDDLINLYKGWSDPPKEILMELTRFYTELRNMMQDPLRPSEFQKQTSDKVYRLIQSIEEKLKPEVKIEGRKLVMHAFGIKYICSSWDPEMERNLGLIQKEFDKHIQRFCEPKTGFVISFDDDRHESLRFEREDSRDRTVGSHESQHLSFGHTYNYFKKKGREKEFISKIIKRFKEEGIWYEKVKKLIRDYHFNQLGIKETDKSIEIEKELRYNWPLPPDSFIPKVRGLNKGDIEYIDNFFKRIEDVLGEDQYNTFRKYVVDELLAFSAESNDELSTKAKRIFGEFRDQTKDDQDLPALVE
ncbi:MAG: hypothetical protein KKE20_03355 [Nanoarchaeota archaeon]|nr:hypothetical protein [Nanoarchaeota archaeon]